MDNPMTPRLVELVRRLRRYRELCKGDSKVYSPSTVWGLFEEAADEIESMFRLMAEGGLVGAATPSASLEEGLKNFFCWAMREGPWEGCDLDGGSVQEKALALGLIVSEPYNPNEHGEPFDDIEPGDEFFVFAPGIQTSSSSKPKAQRLSNPVDDGGVERVLVPREATAAIKAAITVSAWRSGSGVDPATVWLAALEAAEPHP